MNVRPFLVVAALLAALLLTAGCEKKEGATQVAAKVNADEITVHQVNNILAQRQDIKPEAAAQAKRAILETLINQQLARQKAIEAQLDRTPEVLWAIETAKTEILARAHLDGIARTLVKPTPLEIEQYYSKHPELFAQRRIFAFEEIAFVANDEVAAGLREQSSKIRALKDIADWLQSQGIQFTATQGVRAAEQIPLVLLPKIQAMKKSEIQLFKSAGGRYQAIQVVDFLEAPVDEATATPRIQRFLFNQVAAAAIAREMGEIRKQAAIEYLGEFADRAAAADAKTKGKAEVKSFTEAEAEAQAKSEALIKERAQK
jgi:EpsD family peptidyl-prolyl cis-trans isomerase